MAGILVTGSSQGLGLMAGQLLIAQGHEVVLQGRDPTRAGAALADASGPVVGDLSRLLDMRAVAEQAGSSRPVRRGDPQRGGRLD